jgi:transcriptional regulator with XRE-family HTH domain
MSDALRDRVASRIKDLRIDADMTQEEAARAIGVSTRHFVRWERGQALPYPRNFERLAEVFEVNPEDFVEVNRDTPSHPSQRIIELTTQVAALEQKVEQLSRLLEAQSNGENPPDSK